MEKEKQLGGWRVEMRVSLPPANKHMSVLDSKFGMPTEKPHGDASTKLPEFT